MKNKSNKIILTYFLVTSFLVFASQLITLTYFDNNFNWKSTSLIAVVYIIITSLLLKYFTKKYCKKNQQELNDLLIKNEELFKSNERYDIVAKATSDTIWDWDIESKKFIFNKGIQGIFGYDQKDVGETIDWWFEKIHHEDSIKMSVNIHKYVEQKIEKWQDYYRFQCANGTYKYIYDRGFLVMDENKKVTRIIGAMQDITKLKKEEERLKLLETVITQTKDSVIITEANETSTGIPKILYVNPAFTTLTGYNPEDVIGKTANVFMNKTALKYNFKRISQALKKKEEISFETINLNKNKEEYWTNISMIPITNKDNEHSHWISIQRDISKEKEREKEREQLISELTQNNKDLKQFSYITSHNLRAPLSNLTGLLNLIEDIPVENEELKEILNGFSKSTNQLNETINDLVKVIIIKDSPSIDKEQVVIGDVFENIFNQLSFLISAKKPIIKMDFEKAETIFANKSYFESILLNLMTNSLKYKDDVRKLKIEISSKSREKNTIITFKDNGIGIDLERNKDKIFGLYQRFHDYADSKGLGLYLVKSQVESMGGTISVESEVNKGTSFIITFKNEL
ncbi:PAS domain-containing sensor histidine kinase [Flavobacterium aquatile]|uniref:histidine kinase n=1 Tax=Flavobacterium aquatile LMG 4008 = ATCC 11947 TaxID=1453498 RepID=A0A095SV54_9FLAO|nr:PAS domain-containing protein [Flavobacterium aquatile]KGD68482.1 histidine kinase [Flavobacterium aquatile LMG 4008 = ATCC 11947]OXA68589.1 PAS domain-containing sensor histidine kinase [Flavobacterium aquatile LMG 4008 = ATCC 11947]GEC79470.1 histidine kinase [Flavobacterium aquatile]